MSRAIEFDSSPQIIERVESRVCAATRSDWLAPALIFALAFMLRGAAMLYWNFRGLYGLDAYSYYDYSLALRDALLHGQPIPHFFWPLAYPALVVLASAFVGTSPFAGQLVSLLAGSFVVTFTFLTAREIARLVDLDEMRAQLCAWLSAVWLAFSAELIQYSIVVMADALGLALTVCSAWLLVRYARTHAARFLYLSAAVLAFAFLARIQMALLIFPWSAFTLYAWAQARRGWGERWRDAVGAALIGIVIVAPYLLWVWHNAQLGLESYASEPGFASWNPLNLFRRDFVTPDGHLQFPYTSGTYYAVAALRGGALTPLIVSFFVLGVIALWQQRARGALILLLGWSAAIYLFIGGMPWQNLRFAFPMYPALAIVGAFGLATIGATLQRFNVRAQLSQKQIVALGVMLVLVIQLSAGYLELDKFMTTTRNYRSVAEWLTRTLPADATVVTFTVGEILQHETNLNVVEIYFQTPETLSALRGEHTYLLLDVPSVEGQWAGRAPALNYEFLRDRVGLEEIGTRLTYTLFHIKR
jgi:hypothetical protein